MNNKSEKIKRTKYNKNDLNPGQMFQIVLNIVWEVRQVQDEVRKIYK